MRDSPPNSEDEERELGGPGWEREHGADYAEYLDALLGPDDPMHEAAIKDKAAMEAADAEVEVVLRMARRCR